MACVPNAHRNYFPLQLGNRWVYLLYSQKRGWKRATRYVDSEAEIKGMRVIRLKTTFFPDYFLVADSLGVRAYGADMKTRGRDFVDGSIVIYSDPDTWLLYPLKVGKEWKGSYHFEKELKSGKELYTKVDYKVKVERKGTVEAGDKKYRDSFKVRYFTITTILVGDTLNCEAEVDTSEYAVWYAPDVGPVLIEGFGYLVEFTPGEKVLGKSEKLKEERDD